MYALYDSRLLNAAEGARELIAPTSVAERAAVYWDYFNPSFLFFAGDTGLLNGTRYTGVFLLPMMILVPAGIARVAVHDRGERGSCCWRCSPSRPPLRSSWPSAIASIAR